MTIYASSQPAAHHHVDRTCMQASATHCTPPKSSGDPCIPNIQLHIRFHLLIQLRGENARMNDSQSRHAYLQHSHMHAAPAPTSALTHFTCIGLSNQTNGPER